VKVLKKKEMLDFHINKKHMAYMTKIYILFLSIIIIVSCARNNIGKNVYIEELKDFERIHIKRECSNIGKFSFVRYVCTKNIMSDYHLSFCPKCVTDEAANEITYIIKENKKNYSRKISSNERVYKYKYKYTITTSDGKSHQVSKENIDKYGMAAYADAYKGATVRMRDNNKADYDIPIEHYDAAVGQGLHLFTTKYVNNADRNRVDKIKNLYKAFINEGYDIEDELTFRKNLQDPKKRKAAYDALVKDGYDMEPYNQFETNIGIGGL